MGMRILVTASLMALVLAGCGGQPEPAPQEEIAVMPSYEATGIVAQTLPELVESLAVGEVTSEELTQAYLDRITKLDREGPRLQSIISLNPNALPLARASDQRRANGDTLGPMDGVPVLLKDNIESLDPMPTTAGSLALKTISRAVTARWLPGSGRRGRSFSAKPISANGPIFAITTP
jgi:amidase